MPPVEPVERDRKQMQVFGAGKAARQVEFGKQRLEFAAQPADAAGFDLLTGAFGDDEGRVPIRPPVEWPC